MWNPQQYARFASERSRPFFDLISQIDHRGPLAVVDLGCGNGQLTRTLVERWPEARVLGIDRSLEMLAGAEAIPGRLEFQPGDIGQWQPAGPVDVVVSNAALHWIEDHGSLLSRLVAVLAPGGVLAVQMPNRFRSDSQAAIEAVAADPCWSGRLAGVGLHAGSVQPLDWYARRLLKLGCSVNAWESTYLHVLRGENPVLEWFKGSGLRPLLARLTSEEGAAFEQELEARFRAIYPPSDGVTLFPFPRLFFVAVKDA